MRRIFWRHRIPDQLTIDSDRVEREPDHKDECALERHRRLVYLERKREEERQESHPEQQTALIPKPVPAKPKPISRPTAKPIEKPKPIETTAQSPEASKYRPRARLSSNYFENHLTYTTTILQHNETEIITGFGTFTKQDGKWVRFYLGHWFELHPELNRESGFGYDYSI